jgi:hypothetical protein
MLAGGVLALFLRGAAEDQDDICFIQLPSLSRGIPLKRWTVSGLPKADSPESVWMDPESDLLVTHQTSVPEV